MSVKESLIAGRLLIDTPEKWAKGPGVWGEDRNCAHQALCQRGTGVMEAICNAIPLRHKIWQWLRGRWSVLESSNIIRYNDHPATTHADIMALFDRAIAAQDDTP